MLEFWKSRITVLSLIFVRDFWVNSLIDTSLKGWNNEVIQQVFSPDIANIILRTPGLDHVVEDKLI